MLNRASRHAVCGVSLVLATTMVTLTEGLGLEVATPADARQILELKGGDRVAF